MGKKDTFSDEQISKAFDQFKSSNQSVQKISESDLFKIISILLGVGKNHDRSKDARLLQLRALNDATKEKINPTLPTQQQMDWPHLQS